MCFVIEHGLFEVQWESGRQKELGGLLCLLSCYTCFVLHERLAGECLGELQLMAVRNFFSLLLAGMVHPP